MAALDFVALAPEHDGEAGVDHLVAVVADFDGARRAWREAGCPLVWDGRTREHRSVCFSVGAVNLEFLSKEVLEDWPALTPWRGWTDRRSDGVPVDDLSRAVPGVVRSLPGRIHRHVDQ